MTRKHTRARKFFARLLLVVIGFAIGGVVAELALRVSGYSYPAFYQRDEVRGLSEPKVGIARRARLTFALTATAGAIGSTRLRNLQVLLESQSLAIPIVRRFQFPWKKPSGQ
jgi:hypothetical protein